MTGLLEGVKVVEAALLLTGDYLGMLLADEGADVVKVESPGLGDYIRDHVGEVAPRYSPFHLFVNRNKRSLSLDMKTRQGAEIFARLMADADVFVTGFTGNVPTKLGMGYDQLRAIKPDIVYVQATGFGAEGPYASLPTHGQMMNALVASQAMELGPDGHARQKTPRSRLAEVSDGVVLGPLFAAYAVAGALFRRERTGAGAYFDVSCADAVLAGSWVDSLLKLNEGRYRKHAMPPALEGRPAARYNYYATSDGKFLLFCPEELRFWSSFCNAVGRPELIATHDPELVVDYGDNQDLYDELQRIFLTRTLDEWMELFIANRIPGAPALTVDQVTDDPHVRFRQMIVEEQHPVAGAFRTLASPIRRPGEVFEIRVPAPAVGEHTDAVLSELGFGLDEIAALRADGVV